MSWGQGDDLHADPAAAPSEQDGGKRKGRSVWPFLAVAVVAIAFFGVIWVSYRGGGFGIGGAPGEPAGESPAARRGMPTCGRGPSGDLAGRSAVRRTRAFAL